MKPEYNGSRMRTGVGMSCSQHRQSRGHDLTGGSRWIAPVVLCLVCCWFLVLPVAADDLPVDDSSDAGVNSTATLRISASIAEGIGLDVEPVEDEDEDVNGQEVTYIDENGDVQIKTVVQKTETNPPKESDLQVTVSSNNITTNWELKVSSSNGGYMVATDNPKFSMKNPFFFLTGENDGLIKYESPGAALFLDRAHQLIKGNHSISNMPISFGTRQEVTWDDMLLADRYWITLNFTVGSL